MACSWSAAFCGHEHGGVGVVARIVPAHRPFLPRDVCRPRFDVATFIANEDSLDCRGAPARGGTPPAALADCALLLHGIDPIPQRRCCAGGGRGHAGLDQRLSPQVARKHGFGGFLASILRMSWHQLKAWVRHPAVRARYSDFAICSCGGILQICQWYRVCDAGALRAEPLGHPFILRGQNPNR